MLEPGSIPTKGQRLVPNLVISTKHGRRLRADPRDERAGSTGTSSRMCHYFLDSSRLSCWCSVCVWHLCGPVLIGSLCLEISGPQRENEFAGLEAKPPRRGGESNLSVLTFSVHT